MDSVVVVTRTGEVSIVSQDQNGDLHQENVLTMIVDPFVRMRPHDTITISARRTRVAVAGRLTVWNIASQDSFTLDYENSPYCYEVQFHPSDDSLLLATYEARKVTLWNTESKSIINSFQHQGPRYQYSMVRFRPCSDEIIVIRADALIECWLVDNNAPSLLRVLRTDAEWVRSASISDDGSKLALGRDLDGVHQKAIIISALEPATRIPTVLLDHSGLSDLSCISDVQFNKGATVLAASHFNTISLWNVDSGRLQNVLEANACVISLCFVNNNRCIYAALDGGRIQTWDPEAPDPDMVSECEYEAEYVTLQAEIRMDGEMWMMVPLSDEIVLM